MPCYYPKHGYRSRTTNESGKRSIVFNLKDGFQDMPVTVPCGQCIGCRLERSRQWAVRIMHESSLYLNNSFITLTYNDENLPNDRSLNKEHFQLFMKRLRKAFPQKIRYYHCGEYGSSTHTRRPHYHAILFNVDFDDKILWKTQDGNKLYLSEKLTKLWGKGITSIGEVTFDSAAYVARYVTKKITGDDAENHYLIADSETGECFKLEPEYSTSSNRPGIGADWYDKYKDDVYPDDFIIMRGHKQRPPKYYDVLLERDTTEELMKQKATRKIKALEQKEHQTIERLRVREIIQKAKLNLREKRL